MIKLIKKSLILLVRIYQYILSPLLPRGCRYSPSCSEYTIQAIEEWGALRGIYMGLKRIARCNPWGGCGYDPIPKKSDFKK